MRYLGTFVFGLALIGRLAEAQDVEWSEQSVKEHCAGEWQGDYSMQAYCIKTNRSGYDEYIKLVENSDLNRFRAPFTNCRSKWGIQWDMVAYCARQQAEGFQSLASKVQGVPDDIANDIISRCSDEWREDYSMIAYCAENQSMAWRELNE